MVTNNNINQQPGVQPIGAPGAIKKGAEAQPETTEGGIAFKALLDKLQGQADSLRADSEVPLQPEELSSAVDRAHESLQDALSLSDQLLEAFRESAQNPGREQAEGEQ